MKIITRQEAKEQGLKRYFTGKPCKHGHVSERLASKRTCCECKKAYQEAYYEANKDKLNEQRKAYQEAYRESNKDKMKAYYEANKDKLKAYQEANKGKLAEQKKAHYEANPLQSFTRCALARIEKAVGKQRINRAEVELGYTQEDFIAHIESQFVDGMGWGNRSEWHIDHIKPLSLFIKEGITDPTIINALSNLQPLWAKDNLSKGARYNEETQCD